MTCCGKFCTKCGERVLFEKEARGCPRCEVVWHRDCLEAMNMCPACGINVTLLTQAAADERTALSRDRKLRGMAWYIILILLRTMIDVVVVITLYSSGLEIPLRVWITLGVAWLLFFAVWSFAFLGHSGARMYLGIVNLLNALAAVAMLPSLQGWALPSVAYYGFVAWACLFSKDLKYYEDSRH